ncbi:MAG TPA: DinB family protein, partial [Ktedonobacteraceae bacterium]|nr:DinB family protein [Ktedonobacteraceae bacterium]
MLDFTPVRDRTLSFTDLCRDLAKTDLHTLTDEMIDTMLAIIASATDDDVVFTPDDPEANDTFGIPEEKDLSWTLGHVIVHV